MPQKKIVLSEAEHTQVAAAVEDRRSVLDKARKKLVDAHVGTASIDDAIETLDTLKAALGIEPEDMFNQKLEDQ